MKQCSEEMSLKTKYLKIRERWRAPDSEKFRLILELVGSQDEIEKVRKAVFTLEEGA